MRFFLDMWLLNHSMTHDKQKREALLNKGGLFTFATASEHLSDVWFSNMERNELDCKIERYIFQGGVYGSVDMGIAANQVMHGGKFMYVLRMIFPPYKQMKYVYPSIEKHKILIPFFHVHRWFSIIFKGKAGASMQKVKHSFDVSDTRGKSVESLIRELNF